jgi:hypothetical protein
LAGRRRGVHAPRRNRDRGNSTPSGGRGRRSPVGKTSTGVAVSFRGIQRIDTDKVPIRCRRGGINKREWLESIKSLVKVDVVRRIASPTELYRIVNRMNRNYGSWVLYSGSLDEEAHGFAQSFIVLIEKRQSTGE